MKKINYITGMFNIIISTLAAVLGTFLLTKVTGGTASDFVANTSRKDIAVIAGTFVVAFIAILALLMIAVKNIVVSTEEVNYAKERKFRVFTNVINILIVVAFLGVLGYLCYRKRAELMMYSVIDLIMIAGVALFSVVQCVLLVIQFSIIIQNQKIKRLKFKTTADTSLVLQDKIEKTKKNSNTQVERKTEIENGNKKNTENLVKPHIRFKKK